MAVKKNPYTLHPGFARMGARMAEAKRLVDTGGFQKKDRITRRIEITSLADIDAGLKQWLRTAYDMDA